VAISVFIVFAAHALHEHPAWRSRLRTNRDREELDAFVQEVRRFYPFFPAVVARTRRDFEWNGFRFAAGRRTMLDLFGTNHDPRSWHAPAKFRPERFLDREPGLYTFVPQGGGSVERNHRCPGEGITRALMTQAVELLIDRLDATVAPQDLHVDARRLPALPREHFMLRRVRWVD
jgi:fatty-acid peroxygenase